MLLSKGLFPKEIKKTLFSGSDASIDRDAENMTGLATNNTGWLVF